MLEMVVESLNVGLPKKEIFDGKAITTGICKRPVSVPLRLLEHLVLMVMVWLIQEIMAEWTKPFAFTVLIIILIGRKL